MERGTLRVSSSPVAQHVSFRCHLAGREPRLARGDMQCIQRRAALQQHAVHQTSRTARGPGPTWQLLGDCLAVVAHRELGHAGSQGGTCGGLGRCWRQLSVLLWQAFRRADERCEEQLKQPLAAAATAACLGAPGLAPSAGGSLLAAGRAAGGQQRPAGAGSGSRLPVTLANQSPTTWRPQALVLPA